MPALGCLISPRRAGRRDESYLHASSSLFSSSRLSTMGVIFSMKWRSMSAILPAKSSLRVSLPHFYVNTHSVDYRVMAGEPLVDAIGVSSRCESSVVSEPYVDPPMLWLPYYWPEGDCVIQIGLAPRVPRIPEAVVTYIWRSLGPSAPLVGSDIVRQSLQGQLPYLPSKVGDLVVSVALGCSLQARRVL